MAYFTIFKLRNKPKQFLKFYQILLLLSGNISLNPGPCQIQSTDGTKLLQTRGLYFLSFKHKDFII